MNTAIRKTELVETAKGKIFQTRILKASSLYLHADLIHEPLNNLILKKQQKTFFLVQKFAVLGEKDDVRHGNRWRVKTLVLGCYKMVEEKT